MVGSGRGRVAQIMVQLYKKSKTLSSRFYELCRMLMLCTRKRELRMQHILPFMYQSTASNGLKQMIIIANVSISFIVSNIKMNHFACLGQKVIYPCPNNKNGRVGRREMQNIP